MSTTQQGRPSFGIKTTPAHLGYEEISRVWREADEIEEIEHAWLWDHLMPTYGPRNGPLLEGWTLLAALAAQTRRIGLGLLVTSNRLRPPAVLAKIAATVDAVSGGRLTMGIGVGGTRQADGAGGVPGQNPIAAEYAAYGLDLVSPAEGVARLAETCTILRRLWTEERVDFTGRHYRLRGAYCEPRPPRRPPLLIGGWGTRTLRVVAEHAEVWNVPGPPHHDLAFIRERSAVLDRHCAELGRDPAEITRSVQFHVTYEDPAAVRATARELLGMGVSHVVLNLTRPYPPRPAHWVADEIVRPLLAEGVPIGRP